MPTVSFIQVHCCSSVRRSVVIKKGYFALIVIHYTNSRRHRKLTCTRLWNRLSLVQVMACRLLVPSQYFIQFQTGFIGTDNNFHSLWCIWKCHQQMVELLFKLQCVNAYRWLNVRLWYLHCSCTGDTSLVLSHQHKHHFDGLVYDCGISIALAMEILQPCTKPLTRLRKKIMLRWGTCITH